MKSTISARVTVLAARSVLFSGTILASAMANAAARLPPAIDFKLSAREAYEVFSKNFCRVSAGTETYNHTWSSTHSEFVAITCDGQSFGKGGEVSQPGFEQRVDQILSQVMGELLTMGFKVVTCETNARTYKATCTLEKQVMPKSESAK